eukprot:gene9900-10056_t
MSFFQEAGWGMICKVTFSFGPGLTARDLLYSGVIRLVPSLQGDNDSSNSRAIFPVTVPYMGYTRDWSRMPLLAVPKSGQDNNAALTRFQNTLCYAPNSKPRSVGSIMDENVPVAAACTGGVATSASTVLNVSLSVLRTSPECSLRIVVVPQVPVDWLYIQIVANRTGRPLGFAKPIDVSSGNGRADAGDIWTTCLNFDGRYWPSGSSPDTRASIKVNTVYQLRAVMTGPLAVGDAAIGRGAHNTT